jgi:hypothetical protein
MRVSVVSTFSLPPELPPRLAEVAAATGRSRSALVSFVLQTWLDALDLAVAGDGPLPAESPFPIVLGVEAEAPPPPHAADVSAPCTVR